MSYHLTHSDSKHKVETDNPEPYLSQGWVEVAKPAAKSKKDSGSEDD